MGTSTLICPLALLLLRDDTDSSFAVSSPWSSSPRSKAFVVGRLGVDRREVEIPLVGKLEGSGALLGGKEVALNAGEEL